MLRCDGVRIAKEKTSWNIAEFFGRRGNDLPWDLRPRGSSRPLVAGFTLN
jgi:hypothetical protein